MKTFMDENFLLENDTARILYHDWAAKMPIVDYHCHLSPRAIADNARFENIAQVMLGGDHYKWRIMRACGVPERFVTGDATDREKFQCFAESLSRAPGNPVYHWTHLELKRYFDCDLVLNAENAQKIWDICGERLKTLRARDMMTNAGVRIVCTTDDPADTLEYHDAIAADKSFDVKVVPAFRPDKAVNIDKEGFVSYIGTLAAAAGRKIESFADLVSVMRTRLDHFGAHGCKAADHGLDYVPFSPCSEEEADAIFKKALAGACVSVEESEKYKTALLLFFGAEYARRGWVMQLHYGALRNVNTRMFHALGPDTGYDAIAAVSTCGIALLLDALEQKDLLPKTVLYSLNPMDNALLDTVAGCFAKDGVRGQVQHGSAWWFNDTLEGMEEQMMSLATRGVLGNFIGMLTDSRSFVSYPRHEYFRRILCNLLGKLVEGGKYPCDIEALGALVQDISYNNVVRYFGFAD